MGPGRPLLRILQITLSAVATLLVVPFAVNIGSGGDPPGWMRPFVGWLWPVAIACVVAVIVLEAVDRLAPAKPDRVIRHRVGDPRNIPLALAQVTRYVSARQQGSLAERVRIALALDERPAAVRQPAHMVARVSDDVFLLSPDLGIADVFGQLNETMLILGAPGAGKTTQLLDLAAALVAQAKAADQPFVPVLLDLADWVRPRRRRFALGRPDGGGTFPFTEWIVAAMAERYLIGTEIGERWVRDDRIVLLLDGLDEVGEEDRERCISEINALALSRVAVCCREADYDRIGVHLLMQGAVTIRPLTRDQVVEFLTTADPALARVIAGLDADDELWDVLTTPLMLSITVLAHAGRGTLLNAANPARRRRLLFDAYVVEVLSRRRARDHGDPEEVLRALRVLADGARLADAGVRVHTFTAESALNVLPVPAVRVVHFWLLPPPIIAFTATGAVAMATLGTSAAVVPAVIGAVVLAFSIPALSPPTIRKRLALAGYVLASAVVPVVATMAMLAAVERAADATPLVVATWALGAGLLSTAGIWWSERHDIDRAIRATLGVALGVSVVLPAAILLFGYSPVAGRGWAIGVVSMAGALGVFGSTGALPTRAEQIPLSESFWPVVVVPCGLLLLIGITAWRMPGPAEAAFWAPTIGWFLGLLYGILPAALFATAIARPTARTALAIAGEPMPWRQGFVSFAADRGVLTYADGEYRFIHLLVRDHLAACDPPTLAAQVAYRTAELATPSPREPAA